MLTGHAVVDRRQVSRFLLPLVFLLIGSALALSFASIDLTVLAMMRDSHQPAALTWPVVLVVTCLPPTMIGLIPAVRQVEATAVATLLGTDFGGSIPGPARTWDQRWRSVTWFWMHLIAGAAVGAIVVMTTIFGVSLLAGPFLLDQGQHILDIGWAEIRGGLQDGIYPLASLGVGAAAVIALLVIILVLQSLAPPMLGPNINERIAELDGQTTHLLERTRLARELHDSVGHALSVVVLQSAAARRRLATDPASAETSLAAVEDVARNALGELDEVLGLLRDEDRPASRRPLHDLSSLDGLLGAVRGTGQPVQSEVDTEALAGVPAVVSREAYRIVQEGLTNAMRHAPGEPATVRIRRDRGRLHIDVTNPLADDARSTWRRGRGGGRGLDGMRERCRIIGGSVTSSQQHNTWVLRAELPLPAPTKETP
ncbi:hypothetical protein VV02_03545 [Luteipulveratus mongoliensis]|uniref:histidine kinase n=2 Tax=Luteipulveratus mongoliensis TaxID=571913 RepID=A0A0K1JPG1_9MICO|nr:hypothetical protein VV02_03545 [Luteipulveratus mongoliensis]